MVENKEQIKKFLIANSNLLETKSFYPLMKLAYKQFNFDPDDLLAILDNVVEPMEYHKLLDIVTNLRESVVKDTHDKILEKLNDAYQLAKKYNRDDIKNLIFTKSNLYIIKWINGAGWIDSTLNGGIMTQAQREGIINAIDDMEDIILNDK